MTAAYPWLCLAMASFYYLAVSAWFLQYEYHSYIWISEGLLWKRAMSLQMFGVILYLLEVAIPYTLGLEKRFATAVLLVLLIVLDAQF